MIFWFLVIFHLSILSTTKRNAFSTREFHFWMSALLRVRALQLGHKEKLYNSHVRTKKKIHTSAATVGDPNWHHLYWGWKYLFAEYAEIFKLPMLIYRLYKILVNKKGKSSLKHKHLMKVHWIRDLNDPFLWQIYLHIANKKSVRITGLLWWNVEAHILPNLYQWRLKCY